MQRINSLNDQCDIKEKVKHPDEVFLDAFALSGTSGIIVRCAKALDVMVASYEPLEFARKIVCFNCCILGLKEIVLNLNVCCYAMLNWRKTVIVDV